MTVAMLTSMLLTAAPAMALTAATVTAGNTTVAANGTWDIRFTVNTAITGNGTDGGNITITFPSGFTVAQNTGNISSVTIAAGPGWLSTTSFGDPTLTVVTSNSTSASRKVRLSFAAGDVIGADAQVRIILPAGLVTNPSTSGSFNITIATSNETTAVTSNSFSIGLPAISPLPGIVTGKNSAGDILYRDITGNLAAAIGTAGVSRVELEAGTYNATNTASTINQTIIGVGASGTVILTAPAAGVPLTISAYGVVIDNVVINGNIDGTANLTTVTANATLRNVTFNGGVAQLVTGSGAAVTVQNCIFNVTGNVSTGIVTINATVVSTSTFTVDSSGTGISNTGNVTITNSTFTGSGTSTGISIGTGLAASTNNTDIRTSTFTSLRQALVIGNETVYAAGNTITGGGESTASDTRGVITQSAGASTLVNNTISNSNAAYYAIHVSGSGNLTAYFNSITGNTLNVRLTGGTANATHNWWGAASGPTAGSINATDPNPIHVPHLTGATSAGSGVVAFGSSNLSAQTTAGVDVTSSNGTMGAVAAAKYAANPQTVAPTGTPIAYYDVYVGAPADGSTITIRFFAPVTANTQVYYGGGLTGAWSLAGNQGVNVNSGYAFVTISSTSLPSFSDMTGTPFVLTNIVPPPAAPALLSPVPGATGVPTNTGFSWTPVTGASYHFDISTSPTFATLLQPTVTITSNVYGGVALAANTTYFWRVQSMSGTPAQMSAYVVGTFTTAAPVTAITTTAPNITIQAPPPAIVNVPATTVNVAPSPAPSVTINPPVVNVAAPAAPVVNLTVPDPTQPIPTYILWTIVLIGAVLGIALIVLIIRTRRVA
jgi:hypothetical protein